MSIELIKKLREMTGAGMMDVKKALDASNNDIDAAIEWLRTNGIAKAAKKADRIAAEGSIFVAQDANRVVMIEMNSETDFVATNERFLDGSNKIVNALLTSGVESLEDALNLEVEGETVEAILTSLTATIGEKITLRRVASFSLEGKAAQAYKHANGRIGTIIVGEGVDEVTLRDIAMHAAAMSPEFLSRDEISAEKIEKETQLAEEELADTLAGKPEEIKANIIKGKVDKTLAESVLLEQAFVKDSSKKIKDIIGSGKLVSYVRYEVGEGIEKAENNFAEEVAAQTAAALNN